VHEWIDTAGALAAWMEQRGATKAPIGLDTEFMRTDTFRPKLALVQVNVGGAVALLDAPLLGAHPPLAERLTQPDAVCVMHSASEDLEALAPLLPHGPAQLYDTQIAAALAGHGAGLSYQKLVALLLGIDLPKAETRSDWLKRPLSAAQLDYAAQDVVHLPALHAALDAQLGALGRREWLADDCRRLVEKVRHPVPDLQPQRAFRSAADWPRERQALLRRVLLWRDASARTLDKPRSWILDDARALSFVSDLPADANALFERSKGLRALRSAQRKELFDLLHAPLESGDFELDTIPPPLTSAQKRRVGTLRDVVARVAAELNLPEGLLCPRRHIEALVGEETWPAALEGWRKGLLFEPLMAAMKD